MDVVEAQKLEQSSHLTTVSNIMLSLILLIFILLHSVLKYAMGCFQQSQAEERKEQEEAAEKLREIEDMGRAQRGAAHGSRGAAHEKGRLLRGPQGTAPLMLATE